MLMSTRVLIAAEYIAVISVSFSWWTTFIPQGTFELFFVVFFSPEPRGPLLLRGVLITHHLADRSWVQADNTPFNTLWIWSNKRWRELMMRSIERHTFMFFFFCLFVFVCLFFFFQICLKVQYVHGFGVAVVFTYVTRASRMRRRRNCIFVTFFSSSGGGVTSDALPKSEPSSLSDMRPWTSIFHAHAARPNMYITQERRKKVHLKSARKATGCILATLALMLAGWDYQEKRWWYGCMMMRICLFFCSYCWWGPAIYNFVADVYMCESARAWSVITEFAKYIFFFFFFKSIFEVLERPDRSSLAIKSRCDSLSRRSICGHDMLSMN